MAVPLNVNPTVAPEVPLVHRNSKKALLPSSLLRYAVYSSYSTVGTGVAFGVGCGVAFGVLVGLGVAFGVGCGI